MQRSRRIDWRWPAAAATGVALNFVYLYDPWWGTAWQAPVPLLVAAMATPRLREVFALALFAGLLGMVRSGVAALQQGSDLPILGSLLLTIAAALMQALPLTGLVVVWRLAMADAAGWIAALSLPTIAAAFDLLVGRLSPHGTWASWANTQADALPILQLAALGGTPAIVFVMMLLPSMLAVALARQHQTGQFLVTYLPPLVLLIAGAAYGWLRLADPAPMMHQRVALAASDTLDPMPDPSGDAAEATLNAYLGAASALAEQDADLVILPEKLTLVANPAAEERLRGRLAGWAREHRTSLVAGFALITPERRENRAWLLDPDGVVRADYTKQHLIPLFEGRYRAGDADVIVRLPHRNVDVGIAICKDMDFPALSRRYGHGSVHAMLVPALDFGIDGVWHANMAVIRGVENGFSVWRTARQGVLSVSDPYGRIAGDARTRGAPMTTLIVEAPLGKVRTVYGRVGDAFGWLCVAVTGILVFRGSRAYTRGRTVRRR